MEEENNETISAPVVDEPTPPVVDEPVPPTIEEPAPPVVDGLASVIDEPAPPAPIEETTIATEPISQTVVEEPVTKNIEVVQQPIIAESEPQVPSVVVETTTTVVVEPVPEVKTEQIVVPVETQQPQVLVAPVAEAPTQVVQQSAPTVSSNATTLAGTAPQVMLKTKTSNERSLPSVNNQSVDIGDGVRRRNGNADALIVRRFEDIQTAYHSFKRAAEKFAARPCMGKRKIKPDGTHGNFEFITYADCWTMIRAFGAGLRKLGCEPFQTHVGIYSKNRMEWQIVAEGCHTQSLVSIALYDTLGEDSSTYIMNHGEIHTLAFAPEVTDKVFKILPDCTQFLKNLVIFGDDLPADKKEAAKQFGINCYTFNEILDLGKNNPVEDVPPTPDTLSTIMYTSGTTGMPKGVMLTHMNIIAAVTGVSHQLFELSENDLFLSYLPLAHILERVAEFLFFSNGGAVGYWSGDIKYIREDIGMLKPSLLAAVPRVLDRFYDVIRGNLEKKSGFAKTLFNKAYKAKQHAQAKHSKTPIWDMIIFNKLKGVVGGKMKGMLSGGAPLRPEVQTFLATCFDCMVVQGYGLTETTAAGTIQLGADRGTGHIGSPLPCNEIKLNSIPEMNYDANGKPPSGEVWIRGPNVSIGYYKEPEKTAEVFDKDGWFHTGDVGRWNENGTLSIIDRIKNIFKLAQGEYVAAENIEQQLGKAKYISRLWVYGNSFKTQLIGVVVVEPESVLSFAQTIGIANASKENLEEVIKDPRIAEEVVKELDRAGKLAKLKGFEYIKAVHLVGKDFDTINCVTPSMKLQRNKLQQHFQKEIDALYAKLESQEKK